MKYYLQCDGSYKSGEMSIGVLIKKKGEVVIKEIAEALGRGTVKQAECLAILKGLMALQEMYKKGEIPDLTEIQIETDNMSVRLDITGGRRRKNKRKNHYYAELCSKVSGIIGVFNREGVPVKIKLNTGYRNRAAHNLAVGAWGLHYCSH